MKKEKKQKKKQNWYFTFGAGQSFDGMYCVFYGTQEETRQKMFDIFGNKWSMQYSEKEWCNPDEKSKIFNGFKPQDKVTMAEVWGWKQLK